MKLVIQIPCYNEAEQLPATLADLPRSVEGFDSVEWMVIDDGSTDGTAEIARAHGVDHVHRLPKNQGLARAFMAGIETALRRGADVIVNTDADNQYDATNIPDLTRPILAGEAQMVIGARPISEIEHFSPIKRRLQRLGSWAVRKASGVDIPDAPSGFRAMHREAAVRLYVFNRYTYTLETIIQAGYLSIPVVAVPVRVNPPTRDSRLIKSIRAYVMRSAFTIIRIAILYRPFRFFGLAALVLLVPGMAAFLRFLFFYLTGDGAGHIQSLVIGAGLNAMAAILFMGGVLADLIAANRVLLADLRGRQFKAELAAEEAHRARADAP